MMSFRSAWVLSSIAALSLFAVGCAAPKGGTPVEKRADAQRMRAEALDAFYARMPDMRAQLAAAPGYGVFSGVGTQTIIMSSGNGFGIVRDNATGTDTYMRALKLGGGLGAGITDVRAIVVFHDAAVMRDFVESGWGVTGRADAAAKVGEAGGAGGMVITLPGMTIYRFTENGVMLGGAIEGVKIWKDEELNAM